MLKACAQTRAPTLAASPRQPAAHGGVVDAVLDGVQTTRWKATRQTTRWKATRHEEREVHVRQGGTSTLALISFHFPFIANFVFTFQFKNVVIYLFLVFSSKLAV